MPWVGRPGHHGPTWRAPISARHVSISLGYIVGFVRESGSTRPTRRLENKWHMEGGEPHQQVDAGGTLLVGPKMLVHPNSYKMENLVKKKTLFASRWILSKNSMLIMSSFIRVQLPEKKKEKF